jgi:hypothetical protein
MKYTRYDMKRKNNSNLLLIVVLLSTLVFAFLIGTVVSNVLLKDSSKIKDGIKPNNVVDVVNNNNETKKIKYIAVQGGMFKESGNVDKAKNTLSAYGNPFTIQEQNGTRVLLGIYSEEQGLNMMKALTEKNIENSKITFEINTSSSPCDEAIAAAISAELEVLSKLSDKEIKSIKSSDLKEWLSSLQEIDKSSKNIGLLEEVKAHINALPSEIEKDKAPEYYSFLYSFMKKLISK